MHIQIRIPRPWALLFVFTGMIGFVVWTVETVPVRESGALYASLGGDSQNIQTEVKETEEDIRRLRQQTAVLGHNEEILRYQLRVLGEETKFYAGKVDPELQNDLAQARNNLVSLLKDKNSAEQQMLLSLQQLWEAEQRGGRVSAALSGPVASLLWPVEPENGISAYFMDPSYEKQFGLPHYAIDIPAEQGSVVRAPADGEVVEVAENGLGYSYLILKHQGVVTLYGHVSSFLVEKGQHITQGEPIALSGGRPGSRGAGALSTGPHLHFETIVNGANADPLGLLPNL